MAGLVPAIHDLKNHFDVTEVVDTRHKAGMTLWMKINASAENHRA
jgi:hypothetical protein